ncbi:MAG: V-type ATP synthase subunit E family protein [Patescibacteria group bacterium]
MSIEDIKEKILEDAEVECEKIRKESAEASRKIQEELENEKKDIRNKYQNKLENELETNRERTLSKTKQQRSLETENLLREKISSIFQEHYEKLINLDSDGYKKMLEKLLSTSELENFKGECFTPAKRKKEAQDALSKSKLDKQVDLKESADLAFKGGLVFENDYEYHDLSFETLVSSVKANQEEKIRALLLGS